jgi:hypothetical protein
MKTTSLHSRSFTRYLSMAAMTWFVVFELIGIQPVFAINHGSNAPILTEPSTVPDQDESWAADPLSFDDPVLDPAPKELADPPSGPTYGGFTPSRPGGPWMESPEAPFAQPFVSPRFPAAGMPAQLPVGMPNAGLYGPRR